MPETIDGLPTHPLVVHLPVVLGPLTGLLAIALLIPGLRGRLLRPAAALAVLFVLAVLVAIASGEQLAEARGVSDAHEDAAELLRALAIALAALLVVAALVWRRAAALIRTLLAVAAAALGVAVIATTVETGHEGAKQVWGQAGGGDRDGDRDAEFELPELN